MLECKLEIFQVWYLLMTRFYCVYRFIQCHPKLLSLFSIGKVVNIWIQGPVSNPKLSIEMYTEHEQSLRQWLSDLTSSGHFNYFLNFPLKACAHNWPCAWHSEITSTKHIISPYCRVHLRWTPSRIRFMAIRVWGPFNVVHHRNKCNNPMTIAQGA